MGTNSEQSVKDVLVALPPKIVIVAMVYNKYWTEVWKDHIVSYTSEGLVAANNTCIA